MVLETYRTNRNREDNNRNREDNSDDEDGNRSRSISRVIKAVETTEGEGFIVHRPFPSSEIEYFDPFILLDEMGPRDLRPGEAKGAPDHPHRGFETVTYMLKGEFEHKDSRGNSGKLNSGDVQWMTAGSGVVHSEMPDREFAKSGGTLHAFQLWVNLPKRDKNIKPGYQDISSTKIPIGKSQDGKVSVKVIAGESLGAHAIINTKTPITYLHFTLQPSSQVVQPVPRNYNLFVYVVSGKGIFGNSDVPIERGNMITFKTDGDQVSIKAPADSGSPLDVLLIGGIPMNEPIVQYGPFVMNTEQEINQAIQDYQNGRMGSIDF